MRGRKRLLFIWEISSLHRVIDDSSQTRPGCFEFSVPFGRNAALSVAKFSGSLCAFLHLQPDPTQVPQSTRCHQTDWTWKMKVDISFWSLLQKSSVSVFTFRQSNWCFAGRRQRFWFQRVEPTPGRWCPHRMFALLWHHLGRVVFSNFRGV